MNKKEALKIYKEFMDKLRERNGNLEIMLNRCERNTDEL